MKTLLRCTWIAALMLLPSLARAQVSTTPPAQSVQQQAPPQPTVGPPIQRIETASALSKEPLGTITSVMELSDGRVLVSDGLRRRLLLMDTTLTLASVVLDSLSEIANTYGPRPGALLPYRGDSIMFVDPASYAVVIIGPDGTPGRVRSVWRVEHAPYFTSSTGTYGWPGLDAKGRIVYRIPVRQTMMYMASPGSVPYMPPQPDSALIVAVDLDTRMVDTLGSVRVAVSQMRAYQTSEGYNSFYSESNPLPSADGWAVLSDGTIAIVRALDYRIDYINPDGSRTSSQKLPYEWVRMSEEDKVRMVDSVRTVMQRSANMSLAQQLVAWVNAFGRDYPANFTVPEGFVLPPGLERGALLPKGVSFPDNYLYACPRGTEPPPGSMGPVMVMAGMPPPPPPAGAPTAGGAAPNRPTCAPSFTDNYYPPGMPQTPPSMRPVFVVDPDKLPDYRPPMPPTAAVRADMDGNLWIRTMPVRPTGVVYDIVNRAGELVNRIQLPSGYTLLGFGRGKVVYLSMRDAQGIHLARVRLR